MGGHSETSLETLRYFVRGAQETVDLLHRRIRRTVDEPQHERHVRVDFPFRYHAALKSLGSPKTEDRHPSSLLIRHNQVLRRNGPKNEQIVDFRRNQLPKRNFAFFLRFGAKSR